LELHNLSNQARKAEKETKKLFAKLKKIKPKDLDEKFERFHDEAFEKIDCLTCANCCKTTSPIFTTRDIERLAKIQKLKTSAFIDKYLHLDAENDYVLNTAPCPFLDNDNHCLVYEDRPNACREYPHTNRKKMYQVLDLTFKNTYVCPAVYQIVENIKKITY
jgi:Fe-S-cluster containining protein